MIFPIYIKQVFHEEDLAQHVLFDTGRRRTRLGILKKIEKSEPSQDDTDQPLFLRSCAKDLTISEVTGVTSIFPFQFKSSYVFPCPPKNGQIPFLRNTYKIRHHKKDNGNPTVNYFNLIVIKIHVLPRQNF